MARLAISGLGMEANSKYLGNFDGGQNILSVKGETLRDKFLAANSRMAISVPSMLLIFLDFRLVQLQAKE